MPAKTTAQPTPEPPGGAGKTADSKETQAVSTGEPPVSEQPAGVSAETGARSSAKPGRVRRTERTIHRHSVDEEVVETIVEDLPAAYSPPASDYPATVG
jgi:hypothetical protein